MPKGENLKGKGGLKFGHGQTRKGGGRPKKIYTVLKEKGYSKDDIRLCFQELAFYSENDLVSVINDMEKPQIIKIVAKAYIEAGKTGNYSKVKEIIEQVIGKPTQDTKVEVTTIPSIFIQKGDQFWQKE